MDIFDVVQRKFLEAFAPACVERPVSGPLVSYE